MLYYEKSQFLYLRLYFAVVSASAVKSTEPSSLLDFLLGLWPGKLERFPGGALPQDFWLLRHTRAWLEGKAGYVGQRSQGQYITALNHATKIAGEN